jgi:hypothetical protein
LRRIVWRALQVHDIRTRALQRQGLPVNVKAMGAAAPRSDRAGDQAAVIDAPSGYAPPYGLHDSLASAGCVSWLFAESAEIASA